jgi:acetyl-CoA carboxylase carboxyltransferase component
MAKKAALKKSPIKGLTLADIKAAQDFFNSDASDHIEEIHVVEGGGYHIQTPKELFTAKDTDKKDPKTGKPIIQKVKLEGMFVGGKKVVESYTKKEILDIDLGGDDKDTEEEND